MFRVKFQFNSQMTGYFYSEWFETLEEAKNFVMFAEQTRGIFPQAIEDENGEVI